MPFLDNNVAAGLPPLDPFQVGESDVDSNKNVEQGKGLPYAAAPLGSYVYYDCAVEVMLDSGIVVHNRLPQVNNTADTLAAVNLDSAELGSVTNRGVNLSCSDQYQDIVQRMGHARYWFRIFGQALRLGYQIPIPGIKLIGGVPAIPYDKNPQWASNSIVPGGNYGGIILWRAQWSLWYTTAVPPINQTIPAADPSANVIGSVSQAPATMQALHSSSDSDAEVSV